MIKILATIILVLFSTFAIADESVRTLDKWVVGERLKLWADCKPVYTVFYFTDESSTITLTQEDIEIIVRSRLRTTGIYNEEVNLLSAPIILYVGVELLETASYIEFSFIKLVADHDDALKREFRAITWQRRVLEMHDNNNSLLERVLLFTDEFIDEYLWINTDSC